MEQNTEVAYNRESVFEDSLGGDPVACNGEPFEALEGELLVVLAAQVSITQSVVEYVGATLYTALNAVCDEGEGRLDGVVDLLAVKDASALQGVGMGRSVGHDDVAVAVRWQGAATADAAGGARCGDNLATKHGALG